VLSTASTFACQTVLFQNAFATFTSPTTTLGSLTLTESNVAFFSNSNLGSVTFTANSEPSGLSIMSNAAIVDVLTLNYGVFALIDASLTVNDILLLNQGSVFFMQNSTVSCPTSLVLAQGTVTGNGNFSALSFDFHQVNIYPQSGILNLLTDQGTSLVAFHQNSTIFGVNAGASQLHVDGDIFLSDSSIYLIESFHAPAGSRFTVITTTGQVNGVFSSSLCVDCASPFTFIVEYTNNSVDILIECADGNCCTNYLGVPNQLWDYVLLPASLCDITERLQKTYAVLAWNLAHFPEDPKNLPPQLNLALLSLLDKLFLNCLEDFCLDSATFLTQLRRST